MKKYHVIAIKFGTNAYYRQAREWYIDGRYSNQSARLLASRYERAGYIVIVYRLYNDPYNYNYPCELVYTNDPVVGDPCNDLFVLDLD